MQRQQVSATPAAFNWGPEGVGLRAGCAAAPTWKTLASRASRHASAITAASLPMSSKGSRARQCFTTSLASTLPQPAYCSCTATVGRAHAKLSSSTTMLLRWSRLAARHTLLAMRDTVSYSGGEMTGQAATEGAGRLPCRVFSPQAWRAQRRGRGGGGVPAALPPPLAASFLATPCATSASGSRSSVSPARSCPRSPGAGGGPGQAWRWRQRSTAPPYMPYGLCWGCRDGGACKTTQCQSGEVDGNQSRVASYQPATEVPESGEAGGAICAN